MHISQVIVLKFFIGVLVQHENTVTTLEDIFKKKYKKKKSGILELTKCILSPTKFYSRFALKI